MKEISIELKIGAKPYQMVREMPQTLEEAIKMFGADRIFMWALNSMVAEWRMRERYRIIKGRHRRRPSPIIRPGKRRKSNA